MEPRPETWALVHVAAPFERVIPDGEKEIAELIGVAPDDLTPLSFGVKSTMWMSRAAQRNSEAPLNEPASHALRIHGLALAIRGPVIVHHEAFDPDQRLAS